MREAKIQTMRVRLSLHQAVILSEGSELIENFTDWCIGGSWGQNISDKPRRS